MDETFPAYPVIARSRYDGRTATRSTGLIAHRPALDRKLSMQDAIYTGDAGGARYKYRWLTDRQGTADVIPDLKRTSRTHGFDGD